MVDLDVPVVQGREHVRTAHDVRVVMQHAREHAPTDIPCTQPDRAHFLGPTTLDMRLTMLRREVHRSPAVPAW